MIDTLEGLYPEITFVPGNRYAWDPNDKVVTYTTEYNVLAPHHSLLHEVAHALLSHSHYKNDVDLIKMERDAWSLTKKMLNDHKIIINLDHIEECLDTYRDWIYSRAKCPRCSHVGFQSASNSYDCAFCKVTWKVPESRLCMIKRILAPA